MLFPCKYEKTTIAAVFRDRLGLTNIDLDSSEAVKSCADLILSHLGLTTVLSVADTFGAPYTTKVHDEREHWNVVRLTLVATDAVSVVAFQQAISVFQVFMALPTNDDDRESHDRQRVLSALATREPRESVTLKQLRLETGFDVGAQTRHRFELLIHQLWGRDRYIERYCPDRSEDRDNETLLWLSDAGRQYLSSRGLL